MGEEGVLEKTDEGSSDKDIEVELEDMKSEESTITGFEPCERSSSRIIDASDIALAFDGDTEEHGAITL